MTIVIQVGRCYRTRRGEVVGPLRESWHSPYPFTDGHKTWRADGRYSSPDDDLPNDLVAEISPPSEPQPAPDRLSDISAELERIAKAVTALQQLVDAIRKETHP